MAFSVDDTLSKNEQSLGLNFFLFKQVTMLKSVITKMFISFDGNLGVEQKLLYIMIF